MDNTQLAELLMGIAKAQNAVIEAIERAQPGFKNNHAVPILTAAANVRAALPRIQDLPSRILLRMQGRAAFDVARIQHDLEAALAAAGTVVADDPTKNIPPATARVAARRAAARARAAAAPAPAPAPAPAAPPPASGDDDFDFTARKP
jgi:hypothetical protein